MKKGVNNNKKGTAPR